MTSNFENILIIQLKRIGDVLLTTPAIEVLRKNFPNSKIDFLVEKPSNETVLGIPYINDVLVYDKKKPIEWIFKIRKKKYDLVIDFLSNPRSALITALSGAKTKAGPQYTSSSWAYNLKLEKLKDSNPYNAFHKIDLLKALNLKKIFYPYPKIYITPQDLEWAEKNIVKFKQNDLIIGFSPTSRRKTRIWPAEYFSALAKLILSNFNSKIILFWGPGEKPLADKIVRDVNHPSIFVSPETPTIMKLASIIKKTNIFVSNCNGTKHIAQAVDIPTLAIHSSSSPEAWNPPDDPRHQSIRLDNLECIACAKNTCNNNLKCLTDLKPEIVYNKLTDMLKKLQL